jgi:hypothetical protein
MVNKLGSHVRRNAVGYIALFVALGGTTYAATGGNFILGQSNSAGTPTRLSSPTTDAAGALKVTNTSTTTAGRGITANGGAGGFGLWASGGNATKGTSAIHGQSGASNGVEGIAASNLGSGVYGQNNSDGFGVAGRSANGTGVMGDSSNGWAIQAFGNTRQTRGQTGFVKAAAYVEPGPNGIVRCFNSQYPPDQATSGDCAMTYTPQSSGISDIDFGFQVYDRFVSVTSVGGVDAGVDPIGTSKFRVSTFVEASNSYANQPFYIIVY